MNQSRQSPLAGFFLSLTAAALWGILPVTLKELLLAMDASTIVWYRFLVAGIVLVIWLGVRGNLPRLGSVSKRIRWYLLIAAAGLCSNYFLFSYSLNFVNGETAEAVIQLTTLFLILGGVIFYRESFFFIQKLGTVLIVLGLVLFFNDRWSVLGDFADQQTIGVVIVVGAAITWVAYALLQKRLLSEFSSVQILALIYLFSMVVLLPFVSPVSLFRLDGLQLGILLFLCLNTLVAYGCFAEALNRWDASKVSAVLALAPLFTIASLKLVVWVNPAYEHSDRLNLLSLLGALLLVIGSVLTALMPLLRRRHGAVPQEKGESARVTAN
ncbi:MAG: DMT family transporter [Gammaproteobacteria bacterium]